LVNQYTEEQLMEALSKDKYQKKKQLMSQNEYQVKDLKKEINPEV